MNSRLPIVTIIGRPNVGKSCLFNRLYGRRQAIVDAAPGVTRDRLCGVVEWEGRSFELIDTGGLSLKRKDRMDEAITRQVKKAIASSDLLLLVCDIKDGPVGLDIDISSLLRKSGKKIILVVNKVDNWQKNISLGEFFELGLGEPMGISALHGLGTGELLSRINELLKDELRISPEEAEPIKIAIVGRPNVGKSSFLNALLGEERVIVDREPGTTRDAIDTILSFSDYRYQLIDTAGLAHPRKTKEPVAFYSATRSLQAIKRSDVSLCLIDSFTGIQRDDLRILEEIEKSHCGSIIVANKWDLTKGVKKSAYARRIYQRVNFMYYAPVFFTSAIKKEGVFRVLEEAGRIYHRRIQEFPTPVLNEILKKIQDAKPHPIAGTRKVKFSYITQTGASPPKFTIFTNFPGAVMKNYRTFMDKEFRRNLDLTGTPVKFIFRKKRK